MLNPTNKTSSVGMLQYTVYAISYWDCNLPNDKDEQIMIDVDIYSEYEAEYLFKMSMKIQFLGRLH